MLVLTRKHQEKIRIGDSIVITVLKTKGKAVRLGIEAPMEVPVVRGELAFEGEIVEPKPVSNGMVIMSEAGARPNSAERLHIDRVRAHWPAKTEPVDASMLPPGSTANRVSLQRVSREQASQVLPTLVAGSAPLREMLDRRAVPAQL